MGTNGCTRFGAGGEVRLRAALRLTRGDVVFEFMPGGWVRTANGREFCDLRAFLADARTAKGGA